MNETVTNPDTPQAQVNQHRRWLLGGAGVLAGVAGAGLGWRQWAKGAQDPAVQAFWQLQLARPEGGQLALASLQGKPLIVNFWATWCPPCVRELPMINAFAQAQQERAVHGVQVLGIAVDQAANVNKWLARQPLVFPVALASSGGVSLTRSLGNDNGGLPFTLLLDARGDVQQRKIGEISRQELEQWAQFV